MIAMKYRQFLLLLLLCLLPNVVKAGYFFDSKSQIIGITGDYAALVEGGFANKFFDNKVDLNNCIVLDKKGRIDAKATLRMLNTVGAGKKVLNYLFQYNGKSLSEHLLKERAYENRQLYDEELASQNIIGSDALRENYGDVLKNNYIYFQHNYSSTKISWAVYHVEIDQDTWGDVFACWTDMDKYKQIEVKVTLVASGKSHTSMVGLERNRQLRDLAKKVPQFAIRGQVHRNPFGAYVGIKNGIARDDRMYIYRQFGEGEDVHSRKVSTVRVVSTDKEDCELYSIAGGVASMKKGDVAVLREDSKTNFSFYGQLEKNSQSLNLMIDKSFGYTRTGFANHILLQLGYGQFKNQGDYYYAIYRDMFKQTLLYEAPQILQAGLGYGLGWTVLNRMEIMPYFLVQYEGLLMNHAKTSKDKPVLNSSDNEKPRELFGNSVRVPLGIKANINIAYPFQLFVGAEYNPIAISISDDYDVVKKSFLNTTGFKRNGLSYYAGFRICL